MGLVTVETKCNLPIIPKIITLVDQSLSVTQAVSKNDRSKALHTFLPFFDVTPDKVRV